MDSRTHLSAAKTAIHRLVAGHLVDCVDKLDARFGGDEPSDAGRWLQFVAQVKRRPAAVRRYLSTFVPGDDHPAEATAWEAGLLYGLELAAGALRLVAMSRPPQ